MGAGFGSKKAPESLLMQEGTSTLGTSRTPWVYSTVNLSEIQHALKPCVAANTRQGAKTDEHPVGVTHLDTAILGLAPRQES